MDTYLVSLADRDTGQEQRIVVRAENVTDMQEWVDSRPVGIQGETITLVTPIVIGVRQLHIKRTPKTNFATMNKVAV
jgi:hypothetical protein